MNCDRYMVKKWGGKGEVKIKIINALNKINYTKIDHLMPVKFWN